MSEFFLAINRDCSPFEQGQAERMMSQLDRFGGASKNLLVHKHYAMGIQSNKHLMASQKMPLLIDTHRYLLFDGRIDNRDELISRLDKANSAKTHLAKANAFSDAELIANSVGEFGNECIDSFRGPFIFVIFDTNLNCVEAARDAMGGRYLVYKVTDEHILLSSYEMALVGHDNVAYEINKEKAARYLSNTMEQQSQSLIQGLVPLDPGMLLRVTTQGVKLERYYSFRPNKRTFFNNDEEYATEFKRLLKQAITRRLNGTKQVGLMLSGGLDSVPIAILAAQESDNLLAFSWVFNEYPNLDERQYSSPVCNQYGIEQIMINCDRLWPKFDQTMDLNPIVPFGIPFSEFQEETFRQAKERGVDVLLTGIHGDLLYEGTNGILYELLKARDYKRFCSEFKHLYQTVSSFWLFIKHYVLRPLSVVQLISLQWRLLRPHKSSMLKEDLADLVIEKKHHLWKESRQALRPSQWRVVLDGFAGNDATHGRHLEAKYNIERRYPFRDRDLCEFMLSIPSHQLYFSLQTRPIVKKAFVDEFPEGLLNRNSKTVFSEVIYAGVSNDQKYKPWFNAKNAQWQQYVKDCYFNGQKPINQSLDLVKWRCAYYDYWKAVCYNQTLLGLGKDE